MPVLLAALVAGAAQLILPAKASAQINVLEATWGVGATPVHSPNGCSPSVYPAYYTPVSPGNITQFAALACNGKFNCTYVAWGGPSNFPGIDLNHNQSHDPQYSPGTVGVYGEFPADDPAFGCDKKELFAYYTCGSDPTKKKASTSTQLQLSLSCPLPPVDCAVSDWSAFSACTASCGGGTQTRTRTVTTQPANGGAACPALSESQPCNTQPCPVDCVVSSSGFGSCSVSCGGGIQTEILTVVTPAANGGAACRAPATQSCNTQPCPVDCVVSSNGFGPCSVSCGGGTQTELLTILTEPAHGGAACREPLVQSCNTHSCDTDGDGVVDTSDSCPGTASGSKVDASGCSGAQLVANACPTSGSYKNHGAYVSCVAKASQAALNAGLLTSAEKDAIVSAAGQSGIGKK